MRTFVCLLLFLFGNSALAISLPEKPEGQISDQGAVFDLQGRTRLSLILQEIRNNRQIVFYIVTTVDLGKTDPVAFADELRAAWISEPVGIVLLYVRSRDRIAVSLSDEAFKNLSAKVPLEELAANIDRYNIEGPVRSLPSVVNEITSLLAPEVTQYPVEIATSSPLLLLVPLGVVLCIFGWGVWLLWRFLISRNVFGHSYHFSCEPMSPRFGAENGGSNMSSKKFG